MALPTSGNCEAVAAFSFDRGYYGDVDSAGTKSALVAHWPGAIHEGNGTMQYIVDESCTPAQKEALFKIMSGEDTEEMATMWWVFSMMSPNKLENLVKPIGLEIDMESPEGAHLSSRRIRD